MYSHFEVNENHIKKTVIGLEEIYQNQSVCFSFKFINKFEISKVLNQVCKLTFKKAKTLTGNQVSQDFEISFPVKRVGYLNSLASALEFLFSNSLKRMNAPPCKSPIFNDIAAQKYHFGSEGISPHRDHIKYSGIIVLLNLYGSSRLGICNDRNGKKAKKINDSPGRVVIFPGSKFLSKNGIDLRPLHFVDRIRSERISIGFRHNSQIII